MAWFEKFLTFLFGALIPPPPDATGNLVRRWRVTVAAVTMANASVTVLFVAVAFGAVPLVSAGFAPASRVADLERLSKAATAGQQVQIAQIQQNQLDSKIMDTRIRQCAAIKQRERGERDADSAVQFATSRLQEQLLDYSKLTHQRYRLPDCSEV